MSRQACYTDACSQARGHDGDCTVDVERIRAEARAEGEKYGAAEEREKWKATFAELTKMLAFDVAKARQEALESMRFQCKATHLHPNVNVCDCCHEKFVRIRALAKVKP